MKREPVSAEEVARKLRGFVCTPRLFSAGRKSVPARWRGGGTMFRRAQRLYLHWWRRGVEEQAMHENAPYVCPGCHAVGGERCAPGCIDDEMRRADEDARDQLEEWDYERALELSAEETSE